ncbi:MAG: hypothetical protein GTO22_18975, partial [Gemmatimonadales bacterium]|nr:hypothetical protein [Gemmatimonadales bacterium]
MEASACSILDSPWLQLVCEWESLEFLPRVTIVTLLIGIPLGYVFETLRYAFLLGKPDTVHLAPISVKGKILEDMGHGGVAMALQAELVSVTDVLQGV